MPVRSFTRFLRGGYIVAVGYLLAHGGAWLGHLYGLKVDDAALAYVGLFVIVALLGAAIFLRQRNTDELFFKNYAYAHKAKFYAACVVAGVYFMALPLINQLAAITFLPSQLMWGTAMLHSILLMPMMLLVSWFLLDCQYCARKDSGQFPL